MTLEQSILDAIRILPPEKKAELVSFLQRFQDAESQAPRDRGYGLLPHLNFRVSAEDIDDAATGVVGRLEHLMPSLVLDTHGMVRYTTADPRLSLRTKIELSG
jgi:hypothetical protein